MVGIVLLGIFVLLLAFGAPIAVCLGMSSVGAILVQGAGKPLDAIMSVLPRLCSSASSKFVLLAIPFFILSGNVMEKAGISGRLINLAEKCLGHIRGGMAMVCVVVSCFFAAISGSGPATVAALGLIMIPALKKAGYSPAFACALMAAGGAIGVVIPPSITFVVYGSIADASITDLFKAGVIPGLLMGLALMLYNWATSKKYGWKGNGRRFNFKALGKSFIDSFWAILSPVIILGGIYGGFFTPTEAAAVSCVYTFIIGTFVYKEIHWKEFVDCMKDTVVIAGATSFIVGMSTSFAYVMTLEQVPETLSAFILGISDNKIIILLLMNVFLLVVGMFMDNISSCTILAPILLPVAVALGVNPVHFGIVMTMNLAIGFITPPYGVNLFVGSSVAHIPFERIVKWIWPFIGVIIAVLMLTTYIPQLSLLLV